MDTEALNDVFEAGRTTPQLGSNGSRTRMLFHALGYAALGWPVIPLWPNTKKPMTQVHAGTSDAEQITECWAQTPLANIGICTGEPSGLVVLGVDVLNGEKGDESLFKLALHSGADMPQTLTATTPSGGMHYYFRYPDTEIRCRIALRDGLDVRANGGYIVVPPSRIYGKNYRWNNLEEPIAKMPEWFLRAVNTN